jgi:isopentenyl diphosphate isomerase/L-lactate dehydrogenase-like FMN-dependent dehydrogenase
VLTSPPLAFANVPSKYSDDPISLMTFAMDQIDAAVTWDDVAELRRQWRGNLVVKGLMDTDDIRRAADCGVDAVVVSNHGGRQLDNAAATIDIVKKVREELTSNDLSILVDSGIRHGNDIASCIATGADAVLLGRSYLYGLGAFGEEGVNRTLDILSNELRRCMQLVGATTIDELRETEVIARRRA